MDDRTQYLILILVFGALGFGMLFGDIINFDFINKQTIDVGSESLNDRIIITNNETKEYVCTVGVDCICKNMNEIAELECPNLGDGLLYHKEIWIDGELDYEKRVYDSGLVIEHTDTISFPFEVLQEKV